ncbi:hypothetical protein Godav_022987 [Gossypium davidsonii]|uniref:RNase H type-1 domain-containing protein n=1 Tax=Gossypium davidsonii TaxID=34287 RepID=A0A7J8SQN7_GOSDV|nr:hypothetical protein [Gossypium davidsonii]
MPMILKEFFAFPSPWRKKRIGWSGVVKLEIELTATWELTEHVFRKCSFAIDVWTSLGIRGTLEENELQIKDWVMLEQGPDRNAWEKGWSPLRDPFVKINFDATFDKQYPDSICSRGPRLAIRFRVESGFLKVELEGDALMIIKKVQNQEEDRSILRAYIIDAKRLQKYFVSCRFKHIGKHANIKAHTLAKEGLKDGSETSLGEGSIKTTVRVIVKEWTVETKGSTGVQSFSHET